MGIKGLLPLLKQIQKPINLESYRGKTLGIDAYVWLYKAVFSCATEIGLGQETTKYMGFLTTFLDMLNHYGIKPYLVFDGRNLPSKKDTDSSREENRIKNISLGKQYHQIGDYKNAGECFRKGIGINHYIALHFIVLLRKRNIKYIVAPYEADAQLAYLSKIKMVDAIISEDSDLLVFGCDKVIYKLDMQGNGIEINGKDLHKVDLLASTIGNDFTKFRHVCILSGCDYLDNIPGIGLKKAIDYISNNLTYLKAIQNIRMNKKFKVSEDYEKQFYRAELTFKYQLVFDPIKKQMCHLNEPPLELPLHKIHFIGQIIHDPVLCNSLLTGDRDPNTHQLLLNIKLPYVNRKTGMVIFPEINEEMIIKPDYLINKKRIINEDNENIKNDIVANKQIRITTNSKDNFNNLNKTSNVDIKMPNITINSNTNIDSNTNISTNINSNTNVNTNTIVCMNANNTLNNIIPLHYLNKLQPPSFTTGFGTKQSNSSQIKSLETKNKPNNNNMK